MDRLRPNPSPAPPRPVFKYLLILLSVLAGDALAVEVARQRTYISEYGFAEIGTLFVDGLIDAAKSAGDGFGGNIEIDWDSIELDVQLKRPWHFNIDYVLYVDGMRIHKTTEAGPGRIYMTAYVTGNIGELTSAYWTSTSVPHGGGTLITNTLSVEWYSSKTWRCGRPKRLVNRIRNRFAPDVIAGYVDQGLREIERRVLDIARSGRLWNSPMWSVLDTIKGGLR